MKKLMLVVCVVTLFLAGATAYAGTIEPGQYPDLLLRINERGQGPPDDVHPPGLEHAPGLFRYQGQREKRNRWRVEYDIEADPDPLVTAVFTITNLSPAAQNYTLTAELPIGIPITGGTLTGGSFSGTLLSLGGTAELSSLTGGSAPALYTAKIDDVDFQTLMDAPQLFTAAEFETTPFGPETFGGPIPTFPGPAEVTSKISIDLNFRLSGGDVAVLVGSFVVEPIPEPSSVVLLCIGGVGLLAFAWRRRRRPS